MLDIKQLSGSFWANYDDKGYNAYMNALQIIEEQNDLLISELKDCISIVTMPLYLRTRYMRLVIDDKISYVINPNIRSINFISDKLVNHDKVLYQDTDFYIQDGELIFKELPLTTYNKDYIWLHNVDIDEKLLYKQWGCLVDVEAVSSEAYRQLLLRLFEVRFHGLNDMLFSEILSLLVGSDYTILNNSLIINTIDSQITLLNCTPIMLLKRIKPELEISVNG